MSDAKQKWDEVGNRFSELGKGLKERYGANTEHAAPDEAKLNDALQKVADALDAGFTAIGESLRDPGTRDELKQAGRSIGDAVSATFNDVASEIRKAVRK